MSFNVVGSTAVAQVPTHPSSALTCCVIHKRSRRVINFKNRFMMLIMVVYLTANLSHLIDNTN